jgi:sugar lactone lactonase YvrE
MAMRTTRWIAALAWLVPVVVPACATKAKSQIMFAIQTDLALPKDIDQIRIEVTYEKTGAVIFQNDFTKFEGSDSIQLPATLGFYNPKDPSEAVKIRVIASHGSEESVKVKVLREVVTTVPAERIATLPITIEFLCDGSGQAERDERGNIKRDPSGRVIVKNTCPDGRTCVAGSCVPSELPSAMLLDYKDEDIFGGGTGMGDGACFDPATCFDQGTSAPLDLAAFAADNTTCKAKASGDINVGLRTQGGGICGAIGCFVALNADSDTGWKPSSDGAITLPVKVCEHAVAGKIVGVVTAPVGKDTCLKKHLSVPTCGAWSATGKDVYKPPPANQPTLIASGQNSPLSVGVALGSVYWTDRGTFDVMGNPKNDGAVKVVPVAGGEPTVIAAKQASPHGLAMDAARQFVLWTNAGDGSIHAAPFVDYTKDAAEKQLVDKLLQPEGIVVSGATVYFTELASNKVYRVDTEVIGQDLGIPAGGAPTALAQPTQPVNSPRGIAATKDVVCWTYEDKLMTAGGVVACSLKGETLSIATGERTPRAIAMSADAGGNATGVYWANFDAMSTGGGGIFMMPMDQGMVPDATKTQIAAEDYPAGLVLDGQTLYWTSRSRGTVMSLKLGDAMPTELASGQQNPGAITVDSDAIYWINEGTAAGTADAAPNGAVMKLAKN